MAGMFVGCMALGEARLLGKLMADGSMATEQGKLQPFAAFSPNWWQKHEGLLRRYKATHCGLLASRVPAFA